MVPVVDCGMASPALAKAEQAHGNAINTSNARTIERTGLDLRSNIFNNTLPELNPMMSDIPTDLLGIVTEKMARDGMYEYLCAGHPPQSDRTNQK